MLPVRGSTGAETGRIISFEKAWNASTIPQFLLRRNGTAGTPSKFHDVLVFPSPVDCNRIEGQLSQRKITEVCHRFPLQQAGRVRLVEVNPGLDKTAEEIAEACQKYRYRVVIDTYHLMRGYRPDEIALRPERAGKPSPLGTKPYEWKKAIEILAPYTAGFHLNVDREAYFGGLGYTKEYLLFKGDDDIASRYQDGIFVIVETKPCLTPNMLSSESRELSRKLLNATRNGINGIPGVTVANC